MNNLKYFSKNDLLNKCSSGKINIHDNIKLKNKVQNTLHYVTFLEHLLHLCTSNNTNLLELLFTIKNKIERIRSNMNNTYFNQYNLKQLKN